jgi:hypothetical protein
MSWIEEPESAARTDPDSGRAQYVDFLAHWATEFPAPPPAPETAERGATPRSKGIAPKSLEIPPPPPPLDPGAPAPTPAEFPAEPGAQALPPLTLPRRREATESLRVRLAPEQLHWVRLAAARAGSKVDESALVAAGLALLEQRALDWRAIRTRADLRAALVRGPVVPSPASPEVPAPPPPMPPSPSTPGAAPAGES